MYLPFSFPTDHSSLKEVRELQALRNIGGFTDRGMKPHNYALVTGPCPHPCRGGSQRLTLQKGGLLPGRQPPMVLQKQHLCCLGTRGARVKSSPQQQVSSALDWMLGTSALPLLSLQVPSLSFLPTTEDPQMNLASPCLMFLNYKWVCDRD